MDKIKGKRIQLILIGLVISAIALGAAGLQRIQMEAQHKTISLALDYEEMEKMADQSADDLVSILSAFREMNAAYVGLEEESLRSYLAGNPNLHGQVAEVFFGPAGMGGKAPIEMQLAYEKAQIQPYDYVVAIENPALAGDFYERILARFHQEQLNSYWQEDTEYLVIPGSRILGIYEQKNLLIDGSGRKYEGETPIVDSRIGDIGFGFDANAVEVIELAGLQVMPKVRNNTVNPELAVAALETEFDQYAFENSPLLLTQETPGYPSDVESFSALMEERGFTLALIEAATQREHINQAGMFQLINDADYRAIRLFSVWPYIQERYQYYQYDGGQEIGNALYRAATERNIRILYFKPFKWSKENYVTDLDEYRPIFDDLTRRLAWHGLHWGETPSTFASRRLSTGMLFLLGMGPILVGVLLLYKLFQPSEKNVLAISAVLLGLMGAGLIASRDLMQSLLAFGASFAFASLAGIWLMDRLESAGRKGKSGILPGAVALVQSVAIALMGGLYVGTILSDTRYMLELAIFRGVKASLVLPLFVVGVYALRLWGYKRETKEEALVPDTMRLMKEPLRFGHLAVLGLLAVAAYIYLARSGHESSLQPLNLEMMMRNGLENWIPARPRTKEILVAFPAAVLAFGLLRFDWKWSRIPLGLAATIGFISVTNTFSHLRTPMILSMERTGYSLLFGLVIGVIGTWILVGLVKILRSRREA